MKNREFNKILESVPPDYYQKGVKNNFLKKYWHTTKANFAVRLLKKVKFKNCLDVGSASGYMTAEISKEYPQARFYGVDAAGIAIKHAKKHYPHINFTKAEAENLPYKNNQFDLVLCYETIEHVRNPEKTLLEIRRVLKKRGKLILAMDSGTIPFQVGWFFWEKTFARVWQKAHLNPYHHNDLKNLVTKSGFKIIKKHFTHFKLEVVFLLEK